MYRLGHGKGVGQIGSTKSTHAVLLLSVMSLHGMSLDKYGYIIIIIMCSTFRYAEEMRQGPEREQRKEFIIGSAHSPCCVSAVQYSPDGIEDEKAFVKHELRQCVRFD